MRRLALGLVVWLLLVGCASLPPGDYALIPLSGQTVQPGEWTYGGAEGQYRVEVWQWFETPMVASETPEPTDTAPPTLTPYPTYTPYSTTTPPGAQPTATPDTGITPAPTREAVCEARVEGDYHRLRAERSTEAPVVGSMAPASWMRVERIVRNAEGEWLYGAGENANGAAITGWALVTDNLVLQDSQACWALPFEDEIAPLPTSAPTATPAPPATPVPTGPAPGDCTYSHIYAMTVRSGPGTSHSRVGTLPANTRAVVGHIYPDTASEQWAFIAHESVTGWVAVRAGSVTYGALSGDCAGVRRDAPRLDNPRGLHLIYSANREVVQRALPALSTIKATDGAEWALAAAKAYDPRIVTVYRAIYTPWGKLDCPPTWGQGDPVAAADAWYDMLLGVWGARGVLATADMIEYRNECVFVGDWEIAFDLRMVERANASGVCLLLFSDAPGNPEVAQFAQRRPVLDASLAQECRPGMHHEIAHHIYFGRSSGPWLFGRWQLFAAALGSKYDALDWWITEYGMPAQDGTVIGRGAADCAAARAEMDAIDAIFRADGRVGGYHAYSVGASQEWTDITPCLGAL